MKKIWSIFEGIIRWGLFKVLRLKLTEEQFRKFMQFVGFALVGVSNFIVNYIVYYIFSEFVFKNVKIGEQDIGIYLAQFAGFMISVLNSYYWNNKFVFSTGEGEQRVWWKALLKTYLAYLGSGLILNEILLYLWVEVAGISKFWAPVLNLFITTPINFIVNKLWAFKTSRKPSEEPENGGEPETCEDTEDDTENEEE